MRIINVKKLPHQINLSKLRSLATHKAVCKMIEDIYVHGAGKWKIVYVRPLPDNHRDRICGNTVYTHTVRIYYKPTTRAGIWMMVYGITDKGEIHLWMD